MKNHPSGKKVMHLFITCCASLALLISFSLVNTSSTHAASMSTVSKKPPKIVHPRFTSIQCYPVLSGDAFPLNANASVAVPGCTSTFAWGYTVSGNQSGQAEWNSPDYGGAFCLAEAYIPDNHASAPNAQYFIFDGSNYLANYTFSQEPISNGWVALYNQYFYVSSHMRITLDDHDAGGVGNKYIAASAIKFVCEQ